VPAKKKTIGEKQIIAGNTGDGQEGCDEWKNKLKPIKMTLIHPAMKNGVSHLVWRNRAIAGILAYCFSSTIPIGLLSTLKRLREETAKQIAQRSRQIKEAGSVRLR